MEVGMHFLCAWWRDDLMIIKVWCPTQNKIIKNKIKMATKNFDGHIQNDMLMCSENAEYKYNYHSS